MAEHEDTHEVHDVEPRGDSTCSDVTCNDVTSNDVALPPPSARFTLGSLMLVVTLAAVLFGVIAIKPGVGIGLAVLSIPALVRTIGIQWRRRAAGAPLSPMDKGAAFLASLTVVTVIVISATAAFAVVCFPIGLAAFGSNAEGLIWFGLILGGVAGLVVAFFLARWLWPTGKTWHFGEAEAEVAGQDESNQQGGVEQP